MSPMPSPDTLRRIRENHAYRRRHRGPRKLTSVQREEILAAYAKDRDVSIQGLADQYGVVRQTIYKLIDKVALEVA
jgi:predicted DNA binding protein